MRATQAPKAWRTLLDAMRVGDFEKAQDICKTNRFDKNDSPEYLYEPVVTVERGQYAAMSPRGVIYCDESARGLSRMVGFSENYIASHLQGGVRRKGITRGKMKGWVIWVQE